MPISRHANLRGADLRNANLCRANLKGADLDHADLRGADLHDTNMAKALLHTARFDEIPVISEDFGEGGLTKRADAQERKREGIANLDLPAA